MISLGKAQDIVLAHLPSLKVRDLRLRDACRRVLAQDVHAAIDGPDFDRSLMDGFAVSSRDTARVPAVLKILEYIPAGKSPRKKMRRGTCSMIATGAMLPEGADAVVMKEDCSVIGKDHVKVLKGVKPRENVYKKARDFRRGDLLIRKGSALDMAKVALLASQGKAVAPVFEPPAVAILATGDEVMEPGRKKRPSEVWNATSVMLSYALGEMGIKSEYLGIVKDEPGLLSKKIREGLKYDFFIITGAVSAGDRDFVPRILGKSGVSRVFHKVRIRPGKPIWFGVRGRRLVFGLPGNPVSSMVGFLLFIKPALKQMLGQRPDLRLEEGILSKGVYNGSGRMSFLPARLKAGKKGFIIDPLPYSGSADLSALSQAGALFILEPDKTEVSKNSVVPFLRII